VLLLDHLTREDAIARCEALGEQLWPPLPNIDIQPSLNYLFYEGKYADTQKYWIASNASRAKTINGKVDISFVVPGSQKLPALCTQSAPFSNSTYQDTNSRWQLTVESNSELLTGWVFESNFEISTIVILDIKIIRFRDALSFRFLGIRYASQPERFNTRRSTGDRAEMYQKHSTAPNAYSRQTGDPRTVCS